MEWNGYINRIAEERIVKVTRDKLPTERGSTEQRLHVNKLKI